MPVIPTYRAGVGAPNLAEAYLGSRRIAQQAASDAARIALGREQLAQEAVANQMALAAKREAMAQQAMKDAQEAEIEKAYNETQIGLKQRELANAEAFNAIRIKKAASDFEGLQNYRMAVEGGMPPDAAARRYGFGQPGFAAALEQPRSVSEIPALNFQLSQLNAMERSIMDRYPGIMASRITAADKAQLEEIQRRRSALQIPQSLQQQPTVTGTTTAPSRPSFMYPPMPGNVPSGTQIPPMIGQMPSGSQIIGTQTNAPRTLRVVRDASGKLVIQR